MECPAWNVPHGMSRMGRSYGAGWNHGGDLATNGPPLRGYFMSGMGCPAWNAP
ncbi:hypothetical protein [Arundinibacter roseus]|uniref:hypothetical protein n=1 Tax=Arundinibacter roseus TaxID=2070510 RepID=UPI00140437BC|nr:hypothetical protein [Arundinibacter roseus]